MRRNDTNGVRSRFLFPASPCCLRLSPSVYLVSFILVDALLVVILPLCSLIPHRHVIGRYPLQYSCKNIHSHIPHLPTSTCCYEYCRIPSSCPNPSPQFHSLCLFLSSCIYALLCKSLSSISLLSTPRRSFYPLDFTFILVVSTFISLLVSTIYISAIVFGSSLSLIVARSPSWQSPSSRSSSSSCQFRSSLLSVSQYL